jgi:lipid II:glycine glycyltransferase (peptidoglycan interpeptide bridge formation enzyme)
VLAGVSKSSRQRIRAAEHDLVVVRHDQGEPDRAAAPEDGVFTSPFEPVEAAFGRLADLLATTGARVGFPFARSEVAWWSLAFESGLLVLLEAREAGQDGEPIASLALYRHGGRISTATSADRVDRRREHPGALHLLRWRAAQLAIGEGASELDLGGVDVAGARHVPEQGDPMYGLYEHKRSFGAEWVELAGSHELVLRPWRYALGRGLARVGRLAGRGTSA